MEQRRILIVSYYFPPDSAVGGLRSAKFARLLPEFGWHPYVLTVRDEYRDQGLDHERLRGLGHVTTVQTRDVPSLAALYRRIKSRTRPTQFVSATGAPGANRRESLARRLKRYVVSLCVLLPDEKKNWAFFEAFRAVWMIRKHRIECVLTSSPPASLHFVGLVAKLLTGVRWVADFRDPWIETVFDERSPLTRSRASDRLEMWMEKVVITRADRIVTTTGRLTAALRRRYPTVGRDRFIEVPNSIDTEKFQQGHGVKKYAVFTITYAGTLYIDRSPEPLFRAVSELIAAGKVAASDIRIKLLGNCRTIDGVETRVIAARHGLASVVEILDFVPHSEAIRVMQQSHLLLVLAPEHHQYIVPAKVYDYLGSGSKILALAEEGATTDLMVETGCGECFSQADVGGLRDYLHGLIRNEGFRELRNDPRSFSRFDVRQSTGRLVAELASCCGHPGDTMMARA